MTLFCHLPHLLEATLVHIHWIKKKTKNFHKNTYICFIDYAKAFDCVENS